MSILSVFKPDRAEAVLPAERQALEADLLVSGPVFPGRLTPSHEVVDLDKAKEQALAVAQRCDAGLAKYPNNEMYRTSKSACDVRLQWIKDQEDLEGALTAARSEHKAATAKVAQLQSDAEALETKVAGGLSREAATKAKIDRVVQDLGAAEADGKPVPSLRAELTALQQDLVVDQAMIKTLEERLQAANVTLSEATQRRAVTQAASESAERAQRAREVQSLAGTIVALVHDRGLTVREQHQLRQALEFVWNPVSGYEK